MMIRPPLRSPAATPRVWERSCGGGGEDLAVEGADRHEHDERAQFYLSIVASDENGAAHYPFIGTRHGG